MSGLRVRFPEMGKAELQPVEVDESRWADVEWAKQMAGLWTGEAVSARAVVEQALPPLRAIVGG